MSPELFTTLLAAVLLGGWLVRRYHDKKRRAAGLAAPETSGEDDSLLDFNEKFLRGAGDRPRIPLVRSYSPPDTAMIRSMLDAEGILSYCDANSLGTLYAGVAIEGISDETVLILEEDAEAARAIVADFIQDLAQGPGTARSLPELLG